MSINNVVGMKSTFSLQWNMFGLHIEIDKQTAIQMPHVLYANAASNAMEEVSAMGCGLSGFKSVAYQRAHDAMITSSRRQNDVIMTSFLRRASAGLICARRAVREQ